MGTLLVLAGGLVLAAFAFKDNTGLFWLLMLAAIILGVGGVYAYFKD